MKTSRLLSLILCTLLLLSWQVETADAQTVVNYNYVVKKITKDINGNNSTQEAPGFYRYYLNYADAVKDYNKMMSILKQDPDINIDDKEIRGDFALQRTPKGFFSFNGINGMGVIFGFKEANELILIKQDDSNWQNYKIGRTSEDNKFEFKCRKIAANQYEYEVLVRGEVQLEALNVTGKYKRKTKEESICGIHDDHTYYQYHVTLPKCKKEKNNRILVLPSIIDCETGDTVEHLMPASYEGKSYHKKNSKKKGADAITNNNYIKYIEDLDHDDMGNIMIDSIIKYKKPTSKKYYRCSFKFYIEDAKHVLYEMEEPGTCERTIPFANITMDLPLTEEFYESAEEKFFTKDLGMKLLTPKEAVAAYKENKNGIFSNSDYYNIYAELNDSAETDELTEIVYNRVIKKGEQYDRPIATYVMNKMAMLSIKRGTPDSTILMPLINENINKLNVIKNDPEGIKDSYIQNRPEVLLNQAIIYYMMGDINKATELVQFLDINEWNSDELRKLKEIIH